MVPALNPAFEAGGTVADLVEREVLHPQSGEVFRIRTDDDRVGREITFRCHQTDAFEIAYGVTGQKVTFARYMGQETPSEREAILQSLPDIVLTNYVMLELMLIRPRERSALIASAENLSFLVLDELYTYRGRPRRRCRDAGATAPSHVRDEAQRGENFMAGALTFFFVGADAVASAGP
jgi:hypothetical protein